MAEREYQTIAIDRTFDYLNTTTGNGVIAMPTGTGKSHVISGIVRRALQFRPNARIQMLVNSKELIQQNLDKLKLAWPSAPVGVYSAGLNTKQSYMPVTYAGIKSVKDKANLFGHQDLVIIDEAHQVSQNGETVYRKYLDELREYNPRLRVVGLTATAWRMGLGTIIDGGLFDDFIVDQTQLHIFNRFFDEGYLTRLVPRPMATHLDGSQASMTGGEYNMSEVQALVDDERITRLALQEACDYSVNRRKWLVFAAGVDHADHIFEMLNAMGVPTTVVHRGIESKERTRRIEDYKAGKYRAIVNNNILTTGFDDPGIDNIVNMRPTLSSSLWVQMLGRGTRPLYHPGIPQDTAENRLLAIATGGKPNCQVLDFARNTAQLGPINDPVLPRRVSGRPGDPPIKICQTDRLKPGYTGCGAYNHPSYRFCEHCQAEFDFAIKYTAEASVEALIADGGQEIEWFDVKTIFYSKHVGPSGTPCLRVDYYVTKSKRYTDFVFLEHTGFLKKQAKDWWVARFRFPDWGLPPSVDEALKYANKAYMREPKQIRVWLNKQPIPEVLNYEYE